MVSFAAPLPWPALSFTYRAAKIAQRQIYEEVLDIAGRDKESTPVYEEINPIRGQSGIDKTEIAASNDLFTQVYEEIKMVEEANKVNEYELSQCVAYGLPNRK